MKGTYFQIWFYLETVVPRAFHSLLLWLKFVGIPPKPFRFQPRFLLSDGTSRWSNVKRIYWAVYIARSESGCSQSQILDALLLDTCAHYCFKIFLETWKLVHSGEHLLTVLQNLFFYRFWNDVINVAEQLHCSLHVKKKLKVTTTELERQAWD